MTGHATLFHHVGLITHDMDSTISRYELLGFRFTPLSTPRISFAPGELPRPFGAGNRTAIFERNYLEILAHTDLDLWHTTTPEQRGPYDLDRPLARYAGMHVMHFGTDDIAALHDRLVADGVRCTDIKAFERDVDTPGGQRTMRALTFAFPQGNPEGLIQVAQHLTPELVLQPRFMRHPNGARLVTESIVCAADPDEYTRKYVRYSGGSSHRVDGHVEVDFGGESRIVVVTPDQVGDVVPGAVAPAVPSLVGFTVQVADPAAVVALLTANGVPFRTPDDRVVVAAEDAAGSVVVFRK
jgi:catechol 2,3-dioxygenase-like lactoylglutathione lyase family enzyme